MSDQKEKKSSVFFKNFIAGLAWMFGATLGFAIVVTTLGVLFNWIGGLPVIGEWLADVITWTNRALETRTSLPH